MRSVVLKRDYMQFKKGDVLSTLSDTKENSIEVVHNGRSFDIPRVYCEVTWSPLTPPVSPPIPTKTDTPTLSGLMGADPIGMTAPVAPPSPAVAPPILSLEDNQVHMSFFTGGVLPDSKVDRVISMYPSDTWSDEHWDMIPEFDPNYVWDANMLECLILGQEDQERVLFVGLPGTGKTTAHEQYAAIVGQPFMAINGKDGMEPSSYLGCVAPDGAGGWAWKDGVLPVCMKEGYYLCVDEVFKISAGINMAMQSVWQRGGRLVLDDKPADLKGKTIIPDPKFLLMATDNVKGLGDNFGKFAGTQMQDTSMLDRFDTTYTVPYMPEKTERHLMESMFRTVDRDVIRQIVQVAGLIRKGYATDEISLTLSQRGLRSMCRKIAKDVNPWAAFKYAYLEKLSDPSEIQAVESFAQTCGMSTSI